MRINVLAVPLSMLLATAVGCGVVAEEEEVDDATALTTPEVARVMTADGATWRFLEPEPGVLAVWAVLPDTSAATGLDLDFEGLSYVQVYQQLTSAPVPRALRQAQARADAQLDDEDPSPDDGGLINEAGGGGTTSGISAADFQDDYCWNNFDYLYCWPSFYGSPYVQRKTYSMHGYVAAVNDTVDFRMRYKKFAASGWTTIVSAQALPGQIHYVYSIYFGYRRWRRWEVLDNGNNLVRYSAQGSD